MLLITLRGMYETSVVSWMRLNTIKVNETLIFKFKMTITKIGSPFVSDYDKKPVPDLVKSFRSWFFLGSL